MTLTNMTNSKWHLQVIVEFELDCFLDLHSVKKLRLYGK